MVESSATNQSGDSQRGVADYRRVTVVMLFAFACYMATAGLAFRVVLWQLDYGTFAQPTQVSEFHRSMFFHSIVAIVVGTCALFVRRRRHCGLRWPRAVAVISVLLFTVSLDLIVGAVFPPPSHLESVLAPHPRRGWSHRTGMVGSNSGVIVNINSVGFRGPEVPRKKASDEIRVLFLGDSVTFGFSLTWEDTFIARTAKKLRDRRPDLNITLMNGGVGGYTTWQSLDLFKDEGVRVEPDFVVLNYCMNDMVDLIYLEEASIVGNPIRFSFPNSSHWSGIVRAIQSTYVQQRDKATRDQLVWATRDPFGGPDPQLRSEADLFREPPPESVAAAWRLSIRHLEALNALCEEKGLSWILMYCPLAEQLGSDAVYRQPEKLLRRWSLERGMPYLDLTRAFEAEMTSSGCSPDALLMDSIHPTARGSDIIADEVIRMMMKMRVLPKAKSEVE
ncbi:MAG: SGNH/GDSL hydrolase family protein [Phycisphaerales bacterium]|nr:SGNH/GDSL hydrolase family protein [Phycisphaerales bacterium]